MNLQEHFTSSLDLKRHPMRNVKPKLKAQYYFTLEYFLGQVGLNEVMSRIGFSHPAFSLPCPENKVFIFFQRTVLVRSSRYNKVEHGTAHGNYDAVEVIFRDFQIAEV